MAAGSVEVARIRTTGRSRLLPLAFIAILAAACGLLGLDNPRPDDPNARQPIPPSGAARWSLISWDRVTVELLPRISDEQLDRAAAVTAGPGGFVAVGSNDDVFHYVGRIWRSPDGRAWSLVEMPMLDGLELVDVAASNSTYVAIGTDSSSPNDPVTEILASPDGRDWTGVETVEGAWAATVAAGPLGFAVSLQVGDTTELRLSADGRRWTRVAASVLGPPGTWVADVEASGNGWIAAGRVGDRAVILRSAGGQRWTEEDLPEAGPVPGIARVSAYQVVPGAWATLVLGLDSPPCDDAPDWCTQHQAAWSWTAGGGWVRLPKSNWLVGRGWGGRAFAAGDAGFVVWAGGVTMTSPDGWDWQSIGDQNRAASAYPMDAVVERTVLVAVGEPLGGGDDSSPWFGRATISP